MTEVSLGKTGITVNKNGFGALPIQRIPQDDAVKLVRRAFERGINFFDTARSYTDSEAKLGVALKGIREQVFIATKTPSVTAEGFWNDLETSLRLLQTDYIDIYQFHNPAFCPKPGDGSGLYEAMQQAREQGKIRFIGITNHRLAVAGEAIESDLYATLQFPFSYLTTAGGLINNSAAAYAYLAQFGHVLPIWGVQRENELDEFLNYIDCPPVLTAELQAVIDKDRQELIGSFCRGCGYCMPCPGGIEINSCARMSLMIRRAPQAAQLTDKAQAMMKKIEDCLHCGKCKAKCPYGLDTPRLLEENYQDYREILAGKMI